MTMDLDPKSTFDTFVVGPANRLASAAAKRAAESPGTAYNPLFIYSASGLGKSHILMAVAHHAGRTNEQFRTRYQTLEGFLQELEDALESGDRDGMRDAYRNLDILLMDDVQFLAGQPEAQEMLLATLDALTASESQIVLASDRPPAEIDGLDARLVSRFSGGLIVDISPPELETRIAIIRKKVQERGQSLEPGVAEALARYPFRNIRELGGALNRVLATQDLEGRRLRPSDIPAIVGNAVDVEPETGASGGTVFDEVVDAVATQVDYQEAKWRKQTRELAEAAGRDGYVVVRLRAMLEKEAEPDDWKERLERFRDDIARLREIDRELDRIGNPWPEAAGAMLRDPDRRDEAEGFLASVRERVRPFPRISDGPTLELLAGDVPTIALKASAQLVAPERPQYNPLYLWSRDSDSAVQLLAAAGRTYAAANPDDRMAVTSVKAFAEDFVRALGDGVAGAWRERWWTVDLLLVYGAQDLSETERAQDEFFHLFEALKRRGSRVLMTANCPPSEIEEIDDRLRSRFEGGLVLEVTGTTGAVDEAEVAVAAEPDPEPAAESPWEDVTRTVQADVEEEHADSAVVPPLEEITLGDRAGLFAGEDVVPIAAEERPAERESEGEPPGTPRRADWRPSREKVVWVWPEMTDRLVQELD